MHVLRSSESKNLFPSNEPYDFTIVLPKAFALQGNWTVELSEIYATRINKTTKKELFVYCDICDTSVVSGQYISLLRHVVLDSNKNQIFPIPYPIPLRIQEIEKLRLDIRDKDNNPATFLTGDVILTLVFRPAVNYSSR